MLLYLFGPKCKTQRCWFSCSTPIKREDILVIQQDIENLKIKRGLSEEREDINVRMGCVYKI